MSKKQCPWCSGYGLKLLSSPGVALHSVACTRCGFSGPLQSTKELAWACWEEVSKLFQLGRGVREQQTQARLLNRK